MTKKDFIIILIFYDETLRLHFKPEVLEFTDPNDFNRYYTECEDEFENISTYKLNLKYKIPGYKISQKGKRNNTNEHSSELILIKYYRVAAPQRSLMNSEHEHCESEAIQELTSMVKDLDRRISNIENYLSSDA